MFHYFLSGITVIFLLQIKMLPKHKHILFNYYHTKCYAEFNKAEVRRLWIEKQSMEFSTSIPTENKNNIRGYIPRAHSYFHTIKLKD